MCASFVSACVYECVLMCSYVWYGCSCVRHDFVTVVASRKDTSEQVCNVHIYKYIYIYIYKYIGIYVYIYIERDIYTYIYI